MTKRAIYPYHLRNHWTNKRFKPDCAGGDQDARYYIARRIQERLSQLEQIDVPVAEPDNKPFRWYGGYRRYNGLQPSWYRSHREVIWSMTSSIRVVRLRCHWTICQSRSSCSSKSCGSSRPWASELPICPTLLGKYPDLCQRTLSRWWELDGQDLRPHQRS